MKRALCLVVLCLSASAQTWQQINLPGEISGINNLGDMIGNGPKDGNGQTHCFLRSHVDGSITWPLAALNVTGDVCYGINDHGAIVGSMPQGTPYPINAAFLYQNGTVTSLNPPGATSSAAYGINNPGTIVGDYTDTLGIANAFWLYQGKPPAKDFNYHSLGLLGQVTLTGLNNNATFIGNYGSPARSFMANHGPPVSIDTLPLDGSYTTVIVGVSKYGEIAATYLDANGLRQSFIIEKGITKTIQYPGARQTIVTSIDDWGNVAGTFISPYQTGTFVRWVHCTPRVGCQ